MSRTCFRHYAVLTKTRSKMAMAISFFPQNDTGSFTSALCLMKNLLVVVVFVLILESESI